MTTPPATLAPSEPARGDDRLPAHGNDRADTAHSGNERTPVPAAGDTPPPTTEPLRRAIKHLWAAERRLRGRDSARTGGLSYAQMRAIAALGRRPEMTAGELARDAEVNPASITPLLDHLQSAGIVARTRSAADRRVCLVSLTDEGWKLLRHKLDGWEAHWAQHMAQFSEADLATTTRVLEQVAAILDGLPGS